MDKNSLAHTAWECKYHIAFVPKYRRKVIYMCHIREPGDKLVTFDASAYGHMKKYVAEHAIYKDSIDVIDLLRN